MFDTLLELYTFAGFKQFVIARIPHLLPEECTNLLQCALNSLMFFKSLSSGLPYNRTLCSLQGPPALFRSRIDVALALLEAGADPNKTTEETPGSFYYYREMVQRRSTTKKNPLCLTSWSFVVTMLTNEFYSSQDRGQIQQ